MAEQRSSKQAAQVKNVRWRKGVAHAKFMYKGQVYTKGLDTRVPGDARRLVAEFIADIKSGKQSNDLRGAILQATPSVFATIRPNSRKRYKDSWAHWLRLYDDRDIRSLTMADMSAFDTARRAEGAAPSTIKRDFASLSVVIEYMIDAELMESNPAKAFVRRAVKRRHMKLTHRRRYLELAEQPVLSATILNRVGTTPGRSELLEKLMRFIVATGLRSAEARHVRWEWVNPRRNELVIPAILAERDTDEDDERTKSGVSRRVPLLECAWDAIAGLPREGLLFADENGEPLSKDYVYVSIKRAAVQAGLPGLTVHDLRRTCGVRLLRGQLGVPKLRMEEVSLWLGHSSVKVTEECYAFLEADDLHTAIAKTGT